MSRLVGGVGSSEICLVKYVGKRYVLEKGEGRIGRQQGHEVKLAIG